MLEKVPFAVSTDRAFPPDLTGCRGVLRIVPRTAPVFLALRELEAVLRTQHKREPNEGAAFF
jgi:hypothetical protein